MKSLALRLLHQRKYVILTYGLLLFNYVSYAQIKNVWALGDGEKVFRKNLNHPDKHTNSVWDGRTIRLSGLFNEILAIQIIAETGGEGADAVELVVEAPVEKSSCKVIGGNTLKYGPNGTIEIFTEHYLHVTDSTSPAWYYGGPASAPKNMKGWIPDALIPSGAIPGRGGFPVSIEANVNQGFWIDVHLPRNQKDFPSGIYHGSVQILDEGKTVALIPLEITLLPHLLSDKNISDVWLVHESIGHYYPDLTDTQVDNMIKFEAHRHRVEVTGGFGVNNSPFDEEEMEKFKPYLDGTAYAPLHGYHGPGEGVGDQIFPIGSYGRPVLGETREDVQKQAGVWVDWFATNAPEVKYFWYITDEPGEDRHPWIKERAEWIRSNPGSGKKLPIFTTTHYQENLFGSIDIFAANFGVDLDHLEMLKKNGDEHWFYNGNRPRIGSIITEGEAVDFRINSWIMYKYGINAWFIWDVTHWRHFGSANLGRVHINMFAHPLTYKNRHLSYGSNGDGLLFYPGKMPYYPEEDRGLNQLITSIRLKNLRRGQQDAIIMKMAEQKSGRKKVLHVINKVVPKALSEVEMTDKVPWSERGNAYDEARNKLLELL